jgi:hypothetical protein
VTHTGASAIVASKESGRAAEPAGSDTLSDRRTRRRRLQLRRCGGARGTQLIRINNDGPVTGGFIDTQNEQPSLSDNEQLIGPARTPSDRLRRVNPCRQIWMLSRRGSGTHLRGE